MMWNCANKGSLTKANSWKRKGRNAFEVTAINLNLLLSLLSCWWSAWKNAIGVKKHWLEAVDWSEEEITLLFKVLYLSLSLYLFKNNVVHWSDGEAILQLMFWTMYLYWYKYLRKKTVERADIGSKVILTSWSGCDFEELIRILTNRAGTCFAVFKPPRPRFHLVSTCQTWLSWSEEASYHRGLINWVAREAQGGRKKQKPSNGFFKESTSYSWLQPDDNLYQICDAHHFL